MLEMSHKILHSICEDDALGNAFEAKTATSMI